jgi:hypothetical protein
MAARAGMDGVEATGTAVMPGAAAGAGVAAGDDAVGLNIFSTSEAPATILCTAGAFLFSDGAPGAVANQRQVAEPLSAEPPPEPTLRHRHVALSPAQEMLSNQGRVARETLSDTSWHPGALDQGSVLSYLHHKQPAEAVRHSGRVPLLMRSRLRRRYKLDGANDIS